MYLLPIYDLSWSFFKGEILGGEDRIDPTLFESSGDSLIVNLGTEEWADVSSL